MFVVSELKDIVKILPRDFGKDRGEAISGEINRKYANKVLPDVGLCLCVFDLIDSSEGKVLYGDGCIYHKVHFTLAVFRPFVGESMVGKVKSSSRFGIRVSLEFFDDILIPPRLMQYPPPSQPQILSYFAYSSDESHQEFFWASTHADSAPEDLPPDLLDTVACPPDTRLHLQSGDQIRFRIEEEHFHPVGPKEPPKATVPPPGPDGVPVPEVSKEPEGISPYTLVASCDGPGLGMLAWWQQPEEDEEMQE